MNITVTNYRGVARADLELSGIALVGGPNAAGKSSTAQAVGAALCGETLPIRGLKSSQAGVLVRGGTASGSVEIASETGRTVIDWPKGKATTEGQPPVASPFAAGLRTVIELPMKERSEVLSRYLKSEPTRQDLEAAIAELELSEDHMSKLWNTIQQQGWDGAHAGAKEKGAKLKGQWEDITNERYGSKKASNWVPEDWQPDLDGASEDDLQARVTDARDALEGAIAAEAVSGARIQELETRANLVGGLKEQLEQAKSIRDQVGKDLENARAEVGKLPQPVQMKSMNCPHCHKPVAVVDGKLLPAAEPTPEGEIKARQKAIDEAKMQVTIVGADFDKAAESCRNKARDLDQAESAAKELKECQAQAEQAAAGDVDACRNELARAESRLKAWQRKYNADHRQASIQANQLIADALAPEGVRLKKLETALGAFNKQLAGICDSAAWGQVTVDKELEASLNGTPYFLLSESEKWRVRVSLQLVMAAMDGSAAVVIDGADVLVDRALRNGLFGVLVDLDAQALVCMALRGPDELPDLDGNGIGRAYWLADGVLVGRSEAVDG